MIPCLVITAELPGYLLILSKQSAPRVSSEPGKETPRSEKDESYELILTIIVLTSVSRETQRDTERYLVIDGWVIRGETAMAHGQLRCDLQVYFWRLNMRLTSSQPEPIHHNWIINE